MNILVCSRLSIPARDRTIPDWSHARTLGHDVRITYDLRIEYGGSYAPRDYKPDVIVSMGVGAMEETIDAIGRWPNATLYAYNWDTYEWVWTNPRPGEYDYLRYGRLLKEAREVWVPSECTRRRTRQWWDIDSKVVLSSCPWWHRWDTKDLGYVLCTLRQIPDRDWGLFEQACQELSLPYKMTNHDVTYEEYQDTVAHCRFLVSHLHEASTGGLTLLEGYCLGKPSLLSDSEWHGGRDYMGDRATYFAAGNLNSLKTTLKLIYNNPPRIDREQAKRWVMQQFSDERMVGDILRRIASCEA